MVPEEEINGGAEQNVESRGDFMKAVSGIKALLENYLTMPDVGWIYIDKSIDLASRRAVESGIYYFAETEAEEIDFDKRLGTFVEAPIFAAIVENKLEHHPTAGYEELLDAIMHYLENDDFLD